jgi:hypothetical protein
LRPERTRCNHLYFYYDHALYGLMSVRLQTWFPYSLQVALRGGGALTPGTQFRIGLYYLDGANRVTVGSTSISATEAFVTTSQLLEFSATTPLVQSTDSWAGRNIGIELAALSQNGAPGIAYWELDNVRLSAVPEPGTVALGLAGAAALGLSLRRRRA